jgi:AcrR family transcriptional regulator
MPRRSVAAVKESRARVIDIAVRRASVDGLDGLTIGRLAGEVAMSKSGLFGLFGDKQQLQLATLEAGMELFRRDVLDAVLDVEPGRARLLALCERWLAFHENETLPGGCFMTTVMVEFDARPGALKQAASRTMRRWLDLLEREAALAIERGELSSEIAPADIAFQLNALASAASTNYLLFEDRRAFGTARRSMLRILASADAGEGSQQARRDTTG